MDAAIIRAGLQCGRQRCPCCSPSGNVHCPAHDDQHPSLSVRDDGHGVPLVYCHSGCSQDAVIAALRERGLWTERRNGHEQPLRREWPAYHAETGEQSSVHVREDRPDGKHVWWEPKGVRTADLALYRSNMLARHPQRPAVVCEGEPAADALATMENALGVVAVGTVTGASGTPSDTALNPLVDRTVYLWPDNDDPGAKHMLRIAQRIVALGCSDARIVCWMDAPDKGDVADAVRAGVDVRALLDHAQRWQAAMPALASGAPRIIRLADVQPEQVRWLWPGYIPLGKLTLLAGDPGLGKSWVTLDLVARLTVGGLTPDNIHYISAGAALLLTAEDGLADTIRPRIESQGGDAERVHVLQGIPEHGGSERLPNLIDDVGRIEDAVVTTGASLVVIDPLNAFMGRTDGHVDAQVRRALTPLSRMAERTGAAVLVVMHLNQSRMTPGLYRVQGSIGFVGAARSVLAVAKEHGDPTRRVFAPIKTNLIGEMPALAFGITVEPALVWHGQVDADINELLAGPPVDAGGGARADAEDYLRQALADGPVPAKQVLREASEAGIAEKTLRRAKAGLGIRAVKQQVEGKRGAAGWLWELPNEIQVPNSITAVPGHLNLNGHHAVEDASQDSGGQPVSGRELGRLGAPDEPDNEVALGAQLASGVVKALRCGLNGKQCTICLGIPCKGSVPS